MIVFWSTQYKLYTYVGISGGGRPPAAFWGMDEPGRAGILGADRLGGPGAGLLGSEGACLLMLAEPVDMAPGEGDDARL